MARRARQPAEAAELNMTAMIDVVFQLLIYFIVTIKPVDVITNLDVYRPSAEKQQDKMETPKMIRVNIYPEGFTLNDRPVTVKDMDGLLGKLGSIDKNQTIMIMCAATSRHEDLIRVLNLCAKAGLNNLSVISTN